MEDDDDYNTAVALYEYEEASEKPSSRVLSWLDDLIPKEEAAEDADEADEDTDDAEEPEAEEDGEEEAEEGGEWEEPWPKYGKQTAVEVKKHLDKLAAKDELSAEMAQYVIDFEEGREKPPTRKRIVDHAAKLLAELGDAPEAEEEQEEPEEEAPKRSGRPSNITRGRGTRASRAKAKEEPVSANGNQAGIFVVSGGEEPITAYGLYGAMGAVADLLAAGYESVQVDAG
jgi:hypothetical protein